MSKNLTELVKQLGKRGITQKMMCKSVGITEPSMSRALARLGDDLGKTDADVVPISWAYRLAQFAADRLGEKIGNELKFPAAYAPDHYHALWKCQPAVKRSRSRKADASQMTLPEVQDAA